LRLRAVQVYAGALSSDHHQGELTMSKDQNNKKNDKKKPSKTMKEKKQAKREKKNQGKSPGISNA
jgi:hypothetical protein